MPGNPEAKEGSIVARDWLDILQEMEQWSKDIDRFMTHVNTRPHSMVSSMNYMRWSPSVNIYETDESLLILAEIAGVSPEEINIKYENGHLLVWGQRRQLVPEDVRAVHRMEIQLGPFAFAVEIPRSVSAEGADAQLEAGILLIRMPKRSSAESGIILIRAGAKEGRERGNE
jgi:HSP20 family protein